ncbi:hypothetical protein [Capnocytophaga canimorsus]|uniref:DUF4190 domain-containing protein n=2 Tax=Capnocytophaga canimorsus TaxID=28188 RepID=F9YQY3_CAPCC|nr:hypothetical protein [Capnocytophaga canimorsus]AEK23593.1 Hypothetical protein Ccan_14770 [Capnocytophaga canimorsus Cc5]CEN51068.1 conserved membrane hypothetical protein [Capnocytophaga canimorsus]
MEDTQRKEYQMVFMQPKKSNSMGIAGFVMALISWILVWIPVFGWIAGIIFWFLGLIFSFIGIFRKPRGLAIAGLIISLIWIIFFVLFIAAVVFTALLKEPYKG